MSVHKYKSIKDFEIQAQLNGSSQGSYGVVVNAIRNTDGKEFVMKFFGYTKNKPDISWILREIDNLRALEGIKGVAQIEATFTDTAEGIISHVIQKKQKKKYPIIVMEKLSGGDLFERIVTKKGFSERDASGIFKAFISALTEIHYSRNMINLDLKTENLVFSGVDDTIVKIIDFGMAVSLWDRREHYEDKKTGTSAFLAPETIIHFDRFGQAVYSRASDVWQAGCILYMILAAQYPFGSERTHTWQQLSNNITASKFSIADLNLSSEAIDLLNRIFELDPNKRITCVEILNHPWIVNNSKLPEHDFGEVYKNRLKNWSMRKRFRQLLDRNMLGSNARQRALLSVLSIAKVSNATSTSAGGASQTLRQSPIGTISQLGVSAYDSAQLGYMIRADSSTDYNNTVRNSNPNLRISPSKQESHLRSAILDKLRINRQDIKMLKKTYFEFISEHSEFAKPPKHVSSMEFIASSSPGRSSNLKLNRSQDGLDQTSQTTPIISPLLADTNMLGRNGTSPKSNSSIMSMNSSSDLPKSPVSATRPEYESVPSGERTNSGINGHHSSQSLEQPPVGPSLSNFSAAAHHGSIAFQTFHEIVELAKYSHLSTKGVFDVFDWNGDGTIDFMEFLFTLSSFRDDVDWNDAASVARLYYDVFDMTSSNSISVDVLALVLNKLLNVNDLTAEMSKISVEGNNGIVDETNSVLDSVEAMDEELSASYIYDIVQSIDTDGDGEITFKDFEQFFNVILRLRSMSSR